MVAADLTSMLHAALAAAQGAKGMAFHASIDHRVAPVFTTVFETCPTQ